MPCHLLLMFALLVAGGASWADTPYRTGVLFRKAQPLDGSANRDAMAVVVEGDRLYVGRRGGYLSVYEIASNPLKPRLLGRTETLASATAAVWDFTDPASPKLLKTHSFGTAAEAAAFWRDDLVVPARMMGVLLPR